MFDKTTKPNHADLEALSGPPPVLRSEDRELYGQVRVRFMECLRPADILESLLVQRLIDDAWFIKRYTRHQAVALERSYQQSLQFQVERLKSQNARKEASARHIAEVATRSPAAIAHLVRLENQVFDSPSAFDEILQRIPSELEHNRELEKGIVFQEQLDKLVVSATKRFNDGLELLEHYKEGLGQRLRQVAEGLLTSNGTEPGRNPPPQAEAPSIEPPEGGPAETREANQTPTITEENT